MKTAREAATLLGRVGVWSADPERMTAADARHFANEVEALGFKALWIQESLGSKEIFSHAGILLAATKTLVIATGIANIWARDPVAMANGAKTLVEAYPDRFLLGVGVSHKPSVAIRGGHYEKPLAPISRRWTAHRSSAQIATIRRLRACWPRSVRGCYGSPRSDRSEPIHTSCR